MGPSKKVLESMIGKPGWKFLDDGSRDGPKMRRFEASKKAVEVCAPLARMSYRLRCYSCILGKEVVGMRVSAPWKGWHPTTSVLSWVPSLNGRTTMVNEARPST